MLINVSLGTKIRASWKMEEGGWKLPGAILVEVWNLDKDSDKLSGSYYFYFNNFTLPFSCFHQSILQF